MNAQSLKLLHVSNVVFIGLAWLLLVLQVGMGLYLLVTGGPPVPVGGFDLPARVVGLLYCVGGVVYWFLLLVIAALIRLLLELRDRAIQSQPSTSV